jgi:hypothetical protein
MTAGILTTSAAGHWWAWAAVRESPRPLASPSAESTGAVGNMFLGRARQVVQARDILGDIHINPDRDESRADAAGRLRALWAAATDCSGRIEMRYLADPASGPPERILLVRAEGSTRDDVERSADSLRTTLSRFARRTEPVNEDQQIRRALEPFPLRQGAVFEIRKRLIARRSTRGDTDLRWLTAIAPFRRGGRPLPEVLGALSHRALLSVALAPTVIGDGLPAHLRARAAEVARLASPGSSLTGVYGRSTPPDQFAVLVMPFLNEALARYSDRVFWVRISFAVDCPVGDELGELLANAISPGEPGAGPLGGPAVAVRPEADELQTAGSNIAAVNLDPLPVAHSQGYPQEAVGDLERTLGSIADFDEAAAVFR